MDNRYVDMTKMLHKIQEILRELNWSIQYSYDHPDDHYCWTVLDFEGEEVFVVHTIDDVCKELEAIVLKRTVAKSNTDNWNYQDDSIADKLAALAVTVSKLEIFTNSLAGRSDVTEDRIDSMEIKQKNVFDSLCRIDDEEIPRIDKRIEEIADQHTWTKQYFGDAEYKLVKKIGEITEDINALDKYVLDIANRTEENHKRISANVKNLSRLGGLIDEDRENVNSIEEKHWERIGRLEGRLDAISEILAKLDESKSNMWESVQGNEDWLSELDRSVEANTKFITQAIKSSSDINSEDIDNLKAAVADHNELLSKILDSMITKEHMIEAIYEIDDIVYDLGDSDDGTK